MIKKLGGSLPDSYLEEGKLCHHCVGVHGGLCAGFLLEKKIGSNQPKRLENATILLANTHMDQDKVKVFKQFQH